MQGQGLALQQRQQRAQTAQLRVSAQAATLEAPARATTSGPSEADSQLGTQKPTVRPPRVHACPACRLLPQAPHAGMHPSQPASRL